MATSTQPEFGKLRSFFWPIHRSELRKLMPMFLLFLMISFIYNLLRCLKITLVVNAPEANSSVIPFLKIFFVLPGAFLFIHLFTKCSNRYSREGIFYVLVGTFLVFFALFLFIFYPAHEFFSLDSVMELSEWQYFPQGFTGLLMAIRNWSFSIFYALCELWGTIVLTMLFWGFANEVTSMSEAARFYGIFTLAANLSGICSGFLATLGRIKNPVKFLPFSTPWEQTLFVQISLVLIIGGCIMLLFRWINQNVYHNQPCRIKEDTKTQKLTTLECLKYLAHSRYIVYIVLLVVSYNLVYNLADVLFAESANRLYTNSSDFNAFINVVSILTGILSVILAIVLSGNVIRFFGWTAAAVIAPCIWFVTSAGFFTCLFSQDSSFAYLIAGFFSSPLHLAVYFGAAQLCLGRSSKYTLFDETKEIAFVPLSPIEQRKGKAVVDGVISRLGKSSGSLLIIILLSIFGDLATAMPYIAAIMFTVIGIWIFAVVKLGKMVDKAISGERQKDQEIKFESELYPAR